MRVVFLWPAFVAGLAGLAGCGGAEHAAPVRLPVFPIEGRILIDGSPGGNVQIAFHPLGIAAGALRPVGISAADGTFRLTTYSFGDGAPAGEYAATVLWVDDSVPFDECGDPTVHDRLKGFYLDSSARRLPVTVLPGPNEVTLRIAVSGAGWSLPARRPAGTK